MTEPGLPDAPEPLRRRARAAALRALVRAAGVAPPAAVEAALAALAPLALSSRQRGVVAENLAAAAELAVEGRFTPVVDGPHPLAEGGEAFARLARGRAHGKVVITVG